MYSFRLYFRVFHGEPAARARSRSDAHHGEGPRSMLMPVGVLAVLSVVGGFLEIPGAVGCFVEVA